MGFWILGFSSFEHLSFLTYSVSLFSELSLRSDPNLGTSNILFLVLWTFLIKMEGSISSGQLLKEFREKDRAEQEEKSKKVPLEKKLQSIRNYTDFYWIEQELEAKLEAVKRTMTKLEDELEDLKAVRGNLDKIRKTKYWKVVDGSIEKSLPGSSSKDAEERYRETQRKKKEFQEKQKETNPNKKRAKV